MTAMGLVAVVCVGLLLAWVGLMRFMLTRETRKGVSAELTKGWTPGHRRFHRAVPILPLPVMIVGVPIASRADHKVAAFGAVLLVAWLVAAVPIMYILRAERHRAAHDRPER